MGEANDRRTAQEPTIRSLRPVTIEHSEKVKEVANGWNAHNLGLRLGTDAIAAATAGVLVAPLITIIDRGIIENASNRRSLRDSILSSLRTLALTPHRFVFSRPFALIFTLYTGTYLTANTIDTASSTISAKPADTQTAGPAKFVATSGANMGLCLFKDSQFTRMFGPVNAGPARAVPSITYALFAFRDSLTVFASFNVPPLLAPRLPMHRLPILLQKSIDRASAAQFIAPAAIQLFSTPLHLLGLDMYNRPTANVIERLDNIKKLWGWSCLARMGRIIPAFGFGGVMNSRVRRRLMKSCE